MQRLTFTFTALSICRERALPGSDNVIPADPYVRSSQSRQSTSQPSTSGADSGPFRLPSQPLTRLVDTRPTNEDSDPDSDEDQNLEDENPDHENDNDNNMFKGTRTSRPGGAHNNEGSDHVTGTHDNDGLDSADMNIAMTNPHDEDEAAAICPINLWDNGEEITVEERNILLQMDSDAERARAMMIRRRDRDLFENGEISHVLPILAKPVYSEVKAAAGKGRQSGNGKAKVVNKKQDVEVAQRRSSSRHQKQKEKKDATPPNNLAINTTVSPPAEPNTLGTSEEDWPGWMKEAVPHLKGMSDSVQWSSLVTQWIQLESHLGYPTGRVSQMDMYSPSLLTKMVTGSQAHNLEHQSPS